MWTAYRKIIKQIINEFWLQLLLSVLWGAYKVQVAPAESNLIATFVANFSAALFLLSWMMGQIVRVKKQQKMEEDFFHVKNELRDLLNKLEQQTKDLVGYSTGGSSIAYFLPLIPSNIPIVHLALINTSSYPVFDFWGEWIDLDEPRKSEMLPFTKHRFELENIYPNRIIENALVFDLTQQPMLRINIFCRSRSSSVTQLVRIAKVNERLVIAYKVESPHYKEQNIPHDFPGYNPDEPDSVFK